VIGDDKSMSNVIEVMAIGSNCNTLCSKTESVAASHTS
jgi:hypothetical protein